MDLFALIDAMFKPSEWEQVTRTDKSKNYFMVNRFMVKEAPIYAAYLNHMKINPVAVVDFWQFFLTQVKGYSRKPQSVYAGGSKKKKDEKEKSTKKSKNIYVPKDDVIARYLTMNDASRRDFDLAMKEFPESTLSELKELETLMYPDF